MEPLFTADTCVVHWSRAGSVLNFKIEKECAFITTESALRRFAELRGLALSNSEELEPRCHYPYCSAFILNWDERSIKCAKECGGYSFIYEALNQCLCFKTNKPKLVCRKVGAVFECNELK